VVEPAADVEGGGGVRRRRLVVAAPWVLGLVAVGAVQAVRAQWLDAAMFLGVSVALALDAAGAFDRMPRTGPVRRAHAARGAAGPWRPARVTAWVAMAAAAVVLVASPRHGILAGAVAFVLGVVAVVVAWAPSTATPIPSRRPARRRAALLWVTVVVAASVWELATFVTGRLVPVVRPEFPSVSEIVDPLLDQPAGRAVFVAAWFALGAFLLTRARTRPAVSATRAADTGSSPVAEAPEDRER
jgi:hypothetical protein